MPGGQFRFIIHPKVYETTVGFYRDALGLRLTGSWDRSFYDRGTLFAAASGTIEVIHLDEGQEFTPPQGVEIAFEVDDLDAWYRRALEEGLRIRHEPTSYPWGHRSFSVLDPNGIPVIMFSVE